MKFDAVVGVVPSISTRLRRSYASVDAQRCWILALVPFLTAFLQTTKITRALAHRGFSLGLTLGLPLPVSSLWKFVSVPSSGVTVTGPDTPAGVGLVAIGLLVQGVLTAGYLGSLRNALAGSDWAFLAAVRRYFRSFLGFGVLLVALFVPPLVVALSAPSSSALLLVWFPILFLTGYLVYAAPYLVVLTDEPLVPSLARSVSLATSEGATLRYAVGYSLLVAGISLPATIIAVNLGAAGVVLGAAVFAPVSLVFDAMTLRFVDDLHEGDAVLAKSAPETVESEDELVESTAVDDDGRK